MRPPSSQLMELPVLMGPSTHSNTWKSTLFVGIVTFHLNIPASSRKIPLDTMVICFRDLNARHTYVSVDVCWSCNRWAGIRYDVEVLDGARHCLSEVLSLELKGQRLVSLDWSISRILMNYTYIIVAVEVLMEGPVLAMFVVGVFDLVSWYPGDGACILSSCLEVTCQIVS